MFCPGRCFSSTWAARQEEVFMLHSIIKDNLPCSTLRVLHGAQQRASKNCSFSTQIKSWPWNLFSVFYLIVTSKIITKAIMTCFAVGNIPYKNLKKQLRSCLKRIFCCNAKSGHRENLEAGKRVPAVFVLLQAFHSGCGFQNNTFLQLWRW